MREATRTFLMNIYFQRLRFFMISSFFKLKDDSKIRRTQGNEGKEVESNIENTWNWSNRFGTGYSDPPWSPPEWSPWSWWSGS